MRINHNQSGVKLYFAIPCYDGNVYHKCMASVIQSLVFIRNNGWDVMVKFIPGDPVLESVRNKFVADFMGTDCTHLLFIDNDVGWDASQLIPMVAKDRDVVCGMVPIRQGDGYSICESGNSDGDLLELDTIGAAFMCIKRETITGMQQHFPGLRCHTYDVANSPGFNFFEFKVEGGHLQGEDIMFCRRCREAGFKIWGMPDIDFTHVDKHGNYKYDNLKVENHVHRVS